MQIALHFRRDQDPGPVPSSLPYCCQCGHDLRNWNVLFESSAMQGRHISHSATLLVECYELSNSNSFLRQILTANIIVLSLSLLLLLPGAGRARRLLFPTYLTAAGRGGIEQQAGRLPGLDPLLALLARCCCPSLVESDRRRPPARPVSQLLPVYSPFFGGKLANGITASGAE